eukprot:Filipodium_phascolosomae@DN2311_c0_g1_i3.p1
MISTNDGDTLSLKVRIVVPNSAVSAIIGRQGTSIKTLQEATGARIQISPRDESLKERIVNVSGPLEQTTKAASQIAELIQQDPNLKEHTNVSYNDVYPT